MRCSTPSTSIRASWGRASAGYLPVVVVDACGYGNQEAARRALDQLAFCGGSVQTDTTTVCALLKQ